MRPFAEPVDLNHCREWFKKCFDRDATSQDSEDGVSEDVCSAAVIPSSRSSAAPERRERICCFRRARFARNCSERRFSRLVCSEFGFFEDGDVISYLSKSVRPNAAFIHVNTGLLANTDILPKRLQLLACDLSNDMAEVRRVRKSAAVAQW
ncbi:MAG: hypothetical protein J0I92_17345 [Phyllobacterium sp.]|nr:hypothetical protein [Phyllobacterium sp.]